MAHRFAKTQFLRAPGSVSKGSEPLIAKAMDASFSFLGRLGSRHSLLLIVIGLLASAALCKTQWTSPKSIWVEYEHLFEAHFGRFFRHTDIIAISAPNASATTDDVVRPEVLEALFHLEEIVNSIEAISSNSSETKRAKLSDLCLRPTPTSACFITSPLWHWNYNLTNMLNDQAYRSTLGRSGYTHPLGFKITPESIMGGAQVQYQQVKYAKLFKTTILFNNTDWAAQYLPDFDLQLRRAVAAFSARSKFAQFYSQDDDSVPNSISSALGSDILIIVGGIMVIYIFVALTLGPTLTCCRRQSSCSFRAVHSKIGLGTFGFLVIGLVFLVVGSIASAAEIITSAITLQVLPVLLLGVGIDSIYVLTHTYWSNISRSADVSHLESALEMTLKVVGPSMLMSSVATTFIFVPVLTLDLPVISSLAAQVIIAVWVNFLLQLLVFAPAVVLDSRRIMAGRMDVLCCFRLKREYFHENGDEPSLMESSKSGSSETHHSHQEPVALDESSGSTDRQMDDSLVGSPPSSEPLKQKPLTRKSSSGKSPFLARILPSVPYRVVVVLFFLCLFILSTIGCSYLKIGLEISSLIPEHSAEYIPYKLISENFNSSMPFFLIVASGHPGEEGQLDFSDPAVPMALLDLKHEIEGTVSTEQIGYWYGDFLSWLRFISSHSQELSANGNQVPKDKFLPWLNEFLSGMGSTHAMSLRLPTNVANSTRFPAMIMTGSLLNTQGLRDILFSFRAMITKINKFTSPALPPLSSSSPVSIAPYSPVFFALGQVDSFTADAIRVIAGALVVSFLVPLIFVHNLIAALICLITMSLLVVSAFAVHLVLGIELNGISIVNVAIGLTLGVEYLSYIFRSYFIPPNKEDEHDDDTARVVSALSFIGHMLLLSILSSLLGMIVLLFTGYRIIRVYFGGMWIGMILLAAIFALVFAPLLLHQAEKLFPKRPSGQQTR